MIYKQITEDCIAAFFPEMEALFAVCAVLSEKEEAFDVYGKEQIEVWRKKYRFLFESTFAMKALNPDIAILEVCSDINLKDATLDSMKKKFLSIGCADRLYDSFDHEKVAYFTKEELEKALTDEKLFDALYGKIENQCPNYIATEAFLRNNDKFVEEFFSLALELMDDRFEGMISESLGDIDRLISEIGEKINELGAENYSQMLLGKTFRNCGPYKQFVFAVSVFMSYNAMRFFVPDSRIADSKMQQQVIFINAYKKERSNDDIVVAIKALSDRTRYQILALLSKSSPIHGRTIVKELDLAPSTVSHHMDVLKECGLITEEQVGTAKYYGINKRNIKELLGDITRDLGVDN